MPLDVERLAIRKLDTSTFTGDTFAVAATLAVPGATVPRLIADGGEVRWKVYGMSSDGDGATQVVDTTASLSTCLVKISKTPGGQTLVSPIVATSGTIVAREVSEDDISTKDVFVLAVPAFVAGAAPFIWIVPTAGCSVAPTGATP